MKQFIRDAFVRIYSSYASRQEQSAGISDNEAQQIADNCEPGAAGLEKGKRLISLGAGRAEQGEARDPLSFPGGRVFSLELRPPRNCHCSDIQNADVPVAECESGAISVFPVARA